MCDQCDDEVTKANAARYLWLRANAAEIVIIEPSVNLGFDPSYDMPEELDVAIDKARSASP